MQATLLPLNPSPSLCKSRISLSSSPSTTFNPSFPSSWKPLVSSSSSKLISFTPLLLQTKAKTTAADSSSSSSFSNNSSNLFKALELGVLFCLCFTYNIYCFNYIYNKQVLKVYHSHVTFTAVQFAIGTLRVPFMWGLNLYTRPKLTTSQLLVHSLVNLFTNTSLGKVAVSFTHIVKSTEPFSYILSILLTSMFLRKLQSLMTHVRWGCEAYPTFQTDEGLLFFEGKLFISASSRFKELLLEEFHAAPIDGDNGIHKTYGRHKENVFWYCMRKDDAEFVKECLTCQQSSNTVPPGQPLPIRESVWENISIDFITELSSLGNHTDTVIFVVADRLSKAAHFGKLTTHFTAVDVAELFNQMIWKLHGMPKSIVSDRNPIFLKIFLQQLFYLNGTKYKMSTAYNPQSDGQTENVNKLLQQYLRCFLHEQPHQWENYLDLAEWNYNTSIHTSTGFSPFQIVYGRVPPSLHTYIAGSTHIQAVEKELQNREKVLQLLENIFMKAQNNTMEHDANIKKQPQPFKYCCP